MLIYIYCIVGYKVMSLLIMISVQYNHIDCYSLFTCPKFLGKSGHFEKKTSMHKAKLTFFLVFMWTVDFKKPLSSMEAILNYPVPVFLPPLASLLFFQMNKDIQWEKD